MNTGRTTRIEVGEFLTSRKEELLKERDRLRTMKPNGEEQARLQELFTRIKNSPIEKNVARLTMEMYRLKTQLEYKEKRQSDRFANVEKWQKKHCEEHDTGWDRSFAIISLVVSSTVAILVTIFAVIKWG